MSPVLVTGAAGFIGFHLCRRLLAERHIVVGVDDLNPYYSVQLKKDRLAQLHHFSRFTFHHLNLADHTAAATLFRTGHCSTVIHLAAQPGVRYSLTNPHAYIDSNVVAFIHVLEGCRHSGVQHFVFASSSSVYGSFARVPFSEHDPVDHPVSLYAATKRSGELLAHTYSHLFQIPTTGLRFFTVYGPWGRPDMAIWRFTEAILANRPIDVYNSGQMQRDFTYIDDIVEGIRLVAARPPERNSTWCGAIPDPATSFAPYRIFNIGNNQPVELNYLITILEQQLNRPAVRNLLPMQLGDVPATFANVDDLAAVTGFRPSTPIKVGIQRFVDWYREYYDRRHSSRQFTQSCP